MTDNCEISHHAKGRHVGKRPPRTSIKRLALIVLVGTIVISITPTIKYFWFSRPIGTGPAGPPVRRALFQASWLPGNVVLLGMGDSVTAGFGASPNHSYFERLVRNPPDEFADLAGCCLSSVLPGLTYENLAVSGTTSLQHIDRQIPLLENAYADAMGVVVITTGGNDIIHDYGRSPPCQGAMYGATMAQARPWIKAFQARLDTMIDRIDDAFPRGCHIFLANIYDPTDGTGDIESAGLPPWPDGAEILRAYNKIISQCANARANVHLVDIHDAFLGHGIHCTKPWKPHFDWSDPHYWYFKNLEDPNDRGYDAIRRLFLNKMADVLGACPIPQRVPHPVPKDGVGD